MIRQEIAAIIERWLPGVDTLAVYAASDEIKDLVLETYGPPF